MRSKTCAGITCLKYSKSSSTNCGLEHARGHGDELGGSDHQQAREVEPEHQHDHAAERPVRRAVVPEAADVEGEAPRGDQPADREDDGARDRPAPADLEVRCQLEHEGGGRHEKEEDGRPADEVDHAEGSGGQPEPLGDLLGHERTADDRHERDEHADPGNEGQPDGEEVAEHERPRLLDVVGAVHRLDQRVRPAGGRPQCPEGADRQEPRPGLTDDLLELRLERGREVGRQVVAHRLDDPLGGVLHPEPAGHERAERRDEEPEREDGEQESERKLGAEPRHVVLLDVLVEAPGDLPDLVPCHPPKRAAAGV